MLGGSRRALSRYHRVQSHWKPFAKNALLGKSEAAQNESNEKVAFNAAPTKTFWRLPSQNHPACGIQLLGQDISRKFSSQVDLASENNDEITADSDFVNDYQGLYLQHDVDCPDEDFKTLWKKIEETRQQKRVVDVVKEWKEAGNELSKVVMDSIILKLFSRMWYIEALKLTKWLDEQKVFELTDSDELIRLEMLAQVGHWAKVTSSFERLSNRSEQAYLILLRLYSNRRLLFRAEALMNQLKESKLITSARPYNKMLRFYLRLGLTDKALETYSELEASGISPDITTYWLLMRYKDTFSSIDVEKKAEAALEKLKVEPENRREIMRLYAALGKSEGVERVWSQTKASPPVTATEYLSAMGSFDILGQIERAEELGGELEVKTNGMSSHQSVLMLRMYSGHGKMDKADSIFQKMVELGHKIDLDSCHQLVAGHLKQNEFDKALEKLKEILERGGIPSYINKLPSGTILMLLEACQERCDVKSAEEVLGKIPDVKDVNLYNALLKVYLSAKTPANGMESRLESADVKKNEETESLLKELEALGA